MQQMMDLTRFHHHHHSKSSTPLHHSMGHHPHPHPHPSHQHSQAQQPPPGLRQHHSSPPSYPIMNPSLRDEREGCRSLICDANGIIIAEMVFRCMICSTVSDSIGDAKIHYHTTHIDTDDDAVGVGPNGHCPDEPLIFPDEELDMESSEEDDHHHQQSHHGGGHLSYQESRSTGGHYRSSNSNRHAAHHHGHGDNNDPLNLSLFDSGLSTSVTQPQTTRAGRKTKPSSAVKAAAAAAAAVTGSQATQSFPTGQTTHGRDESSRTSSAGVRIQTAGTNGTCTIKSGYITCPVCNCTKFYTTLQRRYGQFSCVGCYRFFKEFFVKPKRFGCPNLGSCSLDQRTKCKACWIKKCIDTYTVDDGRRQLLLAHRPVKKNSSSATTPKSPNLSAPISIIPPPPLSSANGSADVKSLNNNNNDYSVAESITCEPDHSPSEIEASEGNENNENNYPSEGEGLLEESEGDVKREEEEQFSPPPAKKTRSSTTTAIDYGTDSNLDCGQGSEEGAIPGEEEGNSLDDVDDLPLDEEADNNVGKDNSIDEGSSLLLRISRDRQDGPVSGSSLLVDQSPSDSQQSTGGSSAGGYSIRPTSSRAAAAAAAAAVSQPRRKTSGRIKNWCCLKCTNCLADDCGKCINCLDRPKFGGPFIRKQRCLYKKCLMKTKPISSSSGNGSQEHGSGGGGSLLYD